MEMDTQVTVHDAMTSNVITIDPKTSIAQAARIMSQKGIGCYRE
jgi:CBS domain-containing protein